MSGNSTTDPSAHQEQASDLTHGLSDTVALYNEDNLVGVDETVLDTRDDPVAEGKHIDHEDDTKSSKKSVPKVTLPPRRLKEAIVPLEDLMAPQVLKFYENISLPTLYDNENVMRSLQ